MKLKNKQGLRVKFVNSVLLNKTCSVCNKEYPRNKNYFYPNKRKNSFGYSPYCITCDKERVVQWNKNNLSKKHKANMRYYSSEIGYFGSLFNGMKRTCYYVASEFPNKESLIQHWKEQQKIYGNKCPATGVEMTMTVGQGKPTPTNISKDRILSWEGYTKINTIFVCWKFNDYKKAMTPKDAKAFLRIVRERFGTDEVE